MKEILESVAKGGVLNAKDFLLMSLTECEYFNDINPSEIVRYNKGNLISGVVRYDMDVVSKFQDAVRVVNFYLTRYPNGDCPPAPLEYAKRKVAYYQGFLNEQEKENIKKLSIIEAVFSNLDDCDKNIHEKLSHISMPVNKNSYEAIFEKPLQKLDIESLYTIRQNITNEPDKRELLNAKILSLKNEKKITLQENKKTEKRFDGLYKIIEKWTPCYEDNCNIESFDASKSVLEFKEHALEMLEWGKELYCLSPESLQQLNRNYERSIHTIETNSPDEFFQSLTTIVDSLIEQKITERLSRKI